MTSKSADQVHHLAAESLRSAGVGISSAALSQQHALSARDLIAGILGSTRPYGVTAPEQTYERWLKDLILSSPHRRTMTREQIMFVGTADFGLTNRRAKEIRRYVIRDLDATTWSRGGAPGGPRQRN